MLAPPIPPQTAPRRCSHGHGHVPRPRCRVDGGRGGCGAWTHRPSFTRALPQAQLAVRRQATNTTVCTSPSLHPIDCIVPISCALLVALKPPHFISFHASHDAHTCRHVCGYTRSHWCQSDCSSHTGELCTLPRDAMPFVHTRTRTKKKRTHPPTPHTTAQLHKVYTRTRTHLPAHTHARARAHTHTNTQSTLTLMHAHARSRAHTHITHTC